MNYYPIYVPAYTTARPSNVAVIDAARQNEYDKRKVSLNIKHNSVIGDTSYGSKYRKKPNNLGTESNIFIQLIITFDLMNRI